MCYWQGCKVTKGQYIRLKAIQKEVQNLRLFRPVQKGFDFMDWPVIKPVAGKLDFEIKEVHWEYIPPNIFNLQQLQQARQRLTWLNARSETLLVNERGRMSMYREGAMHGRCLVISSYFFERRHFPKYGKIGKFKGQLLKTTDNVPYCITVKDTAGYYFMAGVLREWENVERHQSADTFAIVTTSAIGHGLMDKIHNRELVLNPNAKHDPRMPTILPEELAYEWLFGDLDEKRIKEIATYQFPADKMTAWTVAKDFDRSDDPTKEIIYENIPAL
jgi:putative SOS response-associated peptidase YedK